ncbi:MAG: macro domain-containing protein [Candidatus Edwardsbacteria bacterium]
MLRVNEKTISLVQGDITEVEADAIVNAANNYLWMGGGVAGAIKRKGGKVIEEEAVKQGPIAVGEAIVTSAGNLKKAKYVIHAAVMAQDLRTDSEKIRQSAESSLKRAEELRISSIAFPALGTGVGGFPLSKCARVMFEVIEKHFAGETYLTKVIFVLYDQKSYEIFNEIVASPVRNTVYTKGYSKISNGASKE